MPDFALPDIEDQWTPLGAAMASCEEYCVACCCGMDAYNLATHHLRLWADGVAAADVAAAKREVDRAIEMLKDAPETFFFLDCNHWRREVTDGFLRVRKVMAEAFSASSASPR